MVSCSAILIVIIVTINATYSCCCVIGISLYIHIVEIAVHIVFIVLNNFEKVL